MEGDKEEDLDKNRKKKEKRIILKNGENKEIITERKPKMTKEERHYTKKNGSKPNKKKQNILQGRRYHEHRITDDRCVATGEHCTVAGSGGQQHLYTLRCSAVPPKLSAALELNHTESTHRQPSASHITHRCVRQVLC
jgi:hypothetical protein